MSRTLYVTVVAVAVLFLAVPAQPQSEIPTHVTVQNRTGELPFSTSIGTSIEHVDAATGTLNVRIPIMSAPGRGMGASLSLQFNSNYFLLAPRTDSLGNPFFVWTIPVHGVWQTNHPYTSSAGAVIRCVSPATGSDSYSANYIYYDGDGGQHPLAVQKHTNTGTCSGLNDGPNPDLTAAGISAISTSATMPDGIAADTAGNWKDANGNQKSWGFSGTTPGTEVNTVLDTLGRSFFTSSNTLDGNGHPLTTTYTVHDSSGTTRNYVVNWQTINYATAFGNSTGGFGAEHELTTQWYVISSIQLPNNTSYVFKYDNGAYGEITEIDLPTGGVITYSYVNVQNNRRTRRAVASRTETVNGVSSTWNFSIVPTNPVNADDDAYTSTVTYPPVGSPAVANQSVFNSVDGAVTDAKIYAGSATGTPLREYKMVYTVDPDPMPMTHATTQTAIFRPFLFRQLVNG
jgi:hypothetical protein